jgi:hypothetical protein
MSSGSFTPFETFKKKRARSRRHFFPAGHTLFCFVRFSWGLFCNKKRVACNRIYAVTPHVVNVF